MIYLMNKYLPKFLRRKKNTHFQLDVPTCCDCVEDKDNFIQVTLEFLERQIKINNYGE